MNITIKHPTLGTGTVSECKDGWCLFKFPGGFSDWQEITPAEAILDYKSLPLLRVLLAELPVSLSEAIWKVHRGGMRNG